MGWGVLRVNFILSHSFTIMVMIWRLSLNEKYALFIDWVAVDFVYCG